MPRFSEKSDHATAASATTIERKRNTNTRADGETHALSSSSSPPPRILIGLARPALFILFRSFMEKQPRITCICVMRIHKWKQVHLILASRQIVVRTKRNYFLTEECLMRKYGGMQQFMQVLAWKIAQEATMRHESFNFTTFNYLISFYPEWNIFLNF